MVKVPVNERTHESIVPNFQDENRGSSLHSEKDLNNHTRTSEPRVFKAAVALPDCKEGKLVYGDFNANTRFRKIDDDQIHAVRTSPEESDLLVEKLAWIQGDRIERPVRLGPQDFSKQVTEISTDVAYSALDSNPLYIPNVNQEGLEVKIFVFLCLCVSQFFLVGIRINSSCIIRIVIVYETAVIRVVVIFFPVFIFHRNL
eukprot:jgi/Mesvir1/20411/Mv12315-RA.1